MSTHAIVINAPPEQVWPWIVQMGVGRGEFYSYSWLENLVGCRVKNADRLLPQFQNLREGDPIYLHPKASPLKVSYLQKNKSIAFEGWMFQLIRIGTSKTKLVSRTYVPQSYGPKKLSWKMFEGTMNTVFFDLAHFIMSRKQLKEIKRLAERQWNSFGEAVMLGYEPMPI